MKALRAIVLDSTPLGLIATRPGHALGEACRAWLATHLQASVSVYVPSIVRYELRRELLRIGSAVSLTRIDHFVHAAPDRCISLTDEHLDKAAELWASARKRGMPTADPLALDIDVILAAQTLSLNLPSDAYVVATSNVGHLSQFMTARRWQDV